MKRPECVLDESVSILINYILNFTIEHQTEQEESMMTMPSTKNKTLDNSYRVIEFEGVFKIEDPGMISLFVDHHRINMGIKNH